VERWERAVSDDEEELDRAKQAEQKQMSEIDQDMRKLENHKSERMAKKNELDNMDEDIAKVTFHYILLIVNLYNLNCWFVLGSARCW